MTAARDRLSGTQKAAILLIALGPDLSAQVMKHFREEDVERLTLEILAAERVTEEAKEEVLTDCYHLAMARNFITTGGVDYAREMLNKAIGQEKADEIVERLGSARRSYPFDFVRESDPAQLLSFIQAEHPQTIALILSHLRPATAASLITRLESNLQTEVAFRIATMDRTSPEVIEQMEQVLQKKLSQVRSYDLASVGGTSFLVSMLKSVDRGTEKAILASLEATNSELAEEVRALLFVFDDIVDLDDRSLQRLLREVDSQDLALALKGASEAFKERIFGNLSSRAADMLKEEIAVSGPVRLHTIEEAQQRIANTARSLEDAGEIVILRGGEDVIT